MTRFFLLTTLLFTSLKAQALDTSGLFWGNSLRKTSHPMEDSTQENAGGLLRLKYKPEETWQINVETLAYFIKSPLLIMPEKDLQRGEAFLEFNQLSLSYRGESLRVKAGQMTTAWGKSDGLNPTDFLSGKRNILLVTDDALTRRGHTGLSLEWTPDKGAGPWSLELWYILRHAYTDVLLNSELTQDVISLSEQDLYNENEYAAKVNYLGTGFDLEYIYFRGVNKTPLLTEESRSLLPLNIRLKPNYVRQEAHGLNVARDFETYILRGELAYLRRLDTISNADAISNPDRVDLVLGFEKSIGDSHRFNLQGVAHHYVDYQRAPSNDQITRSVQAINNILQAQHQETRLGSLLVYQYEPLDLNQFKFKFSWLNYFHQESAQLFTPQIEYLWTDNLKLTAYALIFEGSPNTPFGVLKDLSSLGLGASFVF